MQHSKASLLQILNPASSENLLKEDKSTIINFFLSVISLYSLLFAGPPDTLWTRTYGGANVDEGWSVQQTSDGGFIIAGRTKSFGAGDYDVYLIRTNSTGDTLWTKTFGGNQADRGFSAQQTNDGGFIITGKTGSFGAGSGDVYIIKTDSNGDSLWIKTYGGTNDDWGLSIKAINGDGFICSGVTWSFGAGMEDVYLIRLNPSGDTLWTKSYGGESSDLGYSVQQIYDGGFIIGGITMALPSWGMDAYLIRVDNNGDTLWTKNFGGPYLDVGYSVQQTHDSGYIITGETSSYSSGSDDAYLIRTDSNGDTIWIKVFGGDGDDMGFSVQQTNDKGYIIAGNTGSYGSGHFDVWIIKTNENGDTLWTKTCGGVFEDNGFGIQQTEDGGFIIVGYTASFGAGGGDVYLIRLDKETVGIQQDHPSNPLNPNNFLVSCYNNLLSIRYTLQHASPVNLSMYNIAGQLVKTIFNEYKNAGDYTINVKTDNSSALYYLKLTSGKNSYIRKALVLKHNIK